MTTITDPVSTKPRKSGANVQAQEEPIFKDKNIESQDDHVLRGKLKKVQGQVSGIVTMYDDQRPCLEIVQQIAAARSALSSVAKDLLAGEASRCARCQTPEDFDRILKSFIELT